MLVIHRLHPGAHRYYLAAVSPGDDQDPVIGESAGTWLGAGSAERGLHGRVEAQDLRRTLTAGAGRLVGMDLTFAAPKSVSVLMGLGSHRVAAVTRRAHDEAVEAGLRHLEDHGCRVRSSGRLEGASGMVAAAFRHRTSRAGDPHLHTHALVANVARGPDGWRALHTPLLYAEARGAAAVYHSVLRHRLASDLGVTWTPSAGGRADAAEVPPEVRRAFSRRRLAVLAEAAGSLDKRGWAERVTRPERQGLVNLASLRESWLGRAHDLGWVPPQLGPGRATSAPPPGIDVIPGADRWTRVDLLVAITDRWVDGAPAAVLEAECDRLLATTGVVRLGRSVDRQRAERFTTTTAVRRQVRVAAALGLAAPPTAPPVIEGEGGPLPDRRGGLGSPPLDDRPEALDRLRRHLAGGGHRLVIAVADAAAAGTVGDRIGVPSLPVAAMAEAVEALSLGPGDVVVVKRPSGLPSAAVEALLVAAGSRGADVVAALDPRRGPAGREPPARASVISVPTVPDPERLTPTAGAVVATVAVPGGELTVAGSVPVATATAIEDWLAVRRGGQAAVLVADAAEVDVINERARASLRSARLLGHTEVAGFAAGDVVWFPVARPALGLERHQWGEVRAVDPAACRVSIRIHGGPAFDLAAGRLGGVRHAHAVPPVAMLVAGRGDVFVVGGRAVADSQVPGQPVHRYLTVPLADTEGPAAADRRARLPAIEAVAGGLREQVRLPPDLAGERRRLDERSRAAQEWAADARRRRQQARQRLDPQAEAAWAAQHAAADRELEAVGAAAADLRRREDERRMVAAVSAPARSRLEALDAQARLRVQALVRAAEHRLPDNLRAVLVPCPQDPAARLAWRGPAEALVAAAERHPERSSALRLGPRRCLTPEIGIGH